jgi:hypothetical protein
LGLANPKEILKRAGKPFRRRGLAWQQINQANDIPVAGGGLVFLMAAARFADPG